MANQKWFIAYDENSKPAIPSLRSSDKLAGVYLIKDDNNKIVYVGMSKTNLYKTFYRHFQRWSDKRSDRIVYPKFFKARILILPASKVARIERYLICKYKPEDNKQKYDSFIDDNKLPAFGLNEMEDCPF